MVFPFRRNHKKDYVTLWLLLPPLKVTTAFPFSHIPHSIKLASFFAKGYAKGFNQLNFEPVIWPTKKASGSLSRENSKALFVDLTRYVRYLRYRIPYRYPI